MIYTRRDLVKVAAVSLAASTLVAKPSSKFEGVQIGINVPYSFRALPDLTADEILRNVLQLNLSAVELRAQPIESFLGGPVGAQIQPIARNKISTQDQEAARRSQAEELRKWRVSLPLNKVESFRKKYEDAGVVIEIVKIDDFTNRIDTMQEGEIDYCFQFAKALGARAISCEPPVSKTKRLGEFAAKHRMMVGYHGHVSANEDEFAHAEAWERAYSYSKYNGINLDIGHYTAAGGDPVAFIRQYHDRITHVHLKDRKAANGPNMPWGQGDTPVKEVLQLISKQGYEFQATIEFEYNVPDGSNVIAEISKCVAFCKEALA